MSSYSGKFNVKNSTGSEITNVHVTQGVSSESAELIISKMENDETSKTKDFSSKTNSNDYWTIKFDLGGITYGRKDKQCNYEERDSPSTASIILESADFSISMPKTSSCDHNYYDS
jgi:hypothetical protein